MHAFLGVVVGLIVGAAIGYIFRNAIGTDISKLKISAWITDLESAAEKDFTSLHNVAASVISDLKKL